MPRATSNSKIIVGAFVVIVLLIAAMTIYANNRFRASERAVADYCGQSLVGEVIENAVQKAKSRSLRVSQGAGTDTGASSLSVGSDGSWLSAISFCTLLHDGTRITRVSYNPWYH